MHARAVTAVVTQPASPLSFQADRAGVSSRRSISNWVRLRWKAPMHASGVLWKSTKSIA